MQAYPPWTYTFQHPHLLGSFFDDQHGDDNDHADVSFNTSLAVSSMSCTISIFQFDDVQARVVHDQYGGRYAQQYWTIRCNLCGVSFLRVRLTGEYLEMIMAAAAMEPGLLTQLILFLFPADGPQCTGLGINKVGVKASIIESSSRMYVESYRIEQRSVIDFSSRNRFSFFVFLLFDCLSSQENDYWYQDSCLLSGANVAYSLYGQKPLPSSTRWATNKAEFQACGKNNFLGSFYTTDGVSQFTKAVASVTGDSAANPSLDTCFSDSSGSGSMGLACYNTDFVLMHFSASGYCRLSYANGIVDPMTSFNQALQSEGCVQIYTKGGDATNIANLLLYSLPCSLNDPIHVCPNPQNQELKQEQDQYREIMGMSVYREELRIHRDLASAAGLGSAGIFAVVVAVIWMLVEWAFGRRTKGSAVSKNTGEGEDVLKPFRADKTAGDTATVISERDNSQDSEGDVPLKHRPSVIHKLVPARFRKNHPSTASVSGKSARSAYTNVDGNDDAAVKDMIVDIKTSEPPPSPVPTYQAPVDLEAAPSTPSDRSPSPVPRAPSPAASLHTKEEESVQSPLISAVASASPASDVQPTSTRELSRTRSSTKFYPESPTPPRSPSPAPSLQQPATDVPEKDAAFVASSNRVKVIAPPGMRNKSTESKSSSLVASVASLMNKKKAAEQDAASALYSPPALTKDANGQQAMSHDGPHEEGEELKYSNYTPPTSPGVIRTGQQVPQDDVTSPARGRSPSDGSNHKRAWFGRSKR